MTSIREALTTTDFVSIQKLYAEDRNESGIIGLTYAGTNWSRYAMRLNVFLWVAEDGGKIVGFLHGYDMADWGFIETLVVAKSARGDGVGATLVKEFEREGTERGWAAVESCVSLTDRKLGKFVESMGYRQAGTCNWVIKDCKSRQ